MEVADVLHTQGEHFLDQHPWLSVQQRTVLRALTRCRTAALGGHVDQCGACGHRAISYNSCRNRHCPKCQAQARARWLAARERELLNVPYVHVVFTLPHALLPLYFRNATQLYTTPVTSAQALNNATLPFVLKLANLGAEGAMKADQHLAAGLNVSAGKIRHKAVAEALDLPFDP